MATLKGSLSYWVCNVQGRVNVGFQTSNEAMRVAEESGGTYSKATAYLSHGASCLYKGLLDEAKQLLLNAVEFSERAGLFPFHALDHSQLAETYYEAGEYRNSGDHFIKAISILEDGQFSSSFINANKVSLARVQVKNNEKDIDLKSLYSYVTDNEVKVNDGWLRRNIGEILMNFNDHLMPESEDWIRSGIEAHQRNGMKLDLGRDYKLYAEWFKRKGDQPRTKENLRKAIDILKECGADGWVEKYEKELEPIS
jgi:tetratricopeptide (TPR) repeat protein